MELQQYLNRSCCLAGFNAESKTEAIEAFARLASQAPAAEGVDPNTIKKKLLEREAQGTTAFGDGIAIPHARIKGLKDFILFAVTAPKGIPYEAIDNKKVHLFFIILAPEEMVSEHVAALAAVSRLFTKPGFRKELTAAKTGEILYETCLKYNSQPKETKPQEIKKFKLFVVILYVQEFIYEILEYFLEEGIEGATIIESSGMGNYVSNIPLFASFIGFMQEDKNRSKTILALIPEEKEAGLVKGIESITGDFDTQQGAMFFSIDLSSFKGNMKML